MDTDWEVCPVGTMAELARAKTALAEALTTLVQAAEMARTNRRVDEIERLREMFEDR